MMIDFLKHIPSDVLIRVKDLDLDVYSDECRDAISDLLKRTVLVGGKRLRPLLTFLTAKMAGLALDRAEILASSIELVHAASLAHDDVVDGATGRRGVPSINFVAGNKRAVLAGDYLLAHVIVALTKTGNLKLVQEMAWVIAELADGEWLQIELAKNRQYSAEAIADVALKKTSSVMVWCCVAPLLETQQSDQVVAYARLLGRHLGLAFQLIDDTLDFSDLSKKDSFLDLENGLVNSVMFEWFKFHPELYRRYQSGESVVDLWNPTHLDQAVENIRQQAQGHLEECRQLLRLMAREMGHLESEEKISKALSPLLFLVDYLGKRSL